MPAPAKPTKKSKIKMTYVVTLILILLAGMSWGYAAYQQSAAEDAKLPKQALPKLLKDFRAYHKSQGKFPETFEHLQTIVWKRPKPPIFGDKGQSFTMRNYYYLLTQITPHALTLWAAPINEKYQEGNTYFLVVYPDRQDMWKGPALEPKDFVGLPVNPSEFQLTTMGLTKQITPQSKAQNSNAKNQPLR